MATMAVQLFVAQAEKRVLAGAKQILVEVHGDAVFDYIASATKLSLPYERSLVQLRRQLADHVIEKEAYPL